MDLKKINFKQPKYLLPVILYFGSLGIGYGISGVISGKNAAKDPRLTDREFLSSELQNASTDSVPLGSKMENAEKQYGDNATDLSAMGALQSDNDSLMKKQAYNSQYTSSEAASINREQAMREAEEQRLKDMQDRVREPRVRHSSSRSYQSRPSDFTAPVSDTEIARIESRRRRQAHNRMEEDLYGSNSPFGIYPPNSVGNAVAQAGTSIGGASIQYNPQTGEYMNIPRYDENGNPLPGGYTPVQTGHQGQGVSQDDNTPDYPREHQGGYAYNTQENTLQVVKKSNGNSSYFNTLSAPGSSSKLIKAIIDENIKAVSGSRVRLRLLDDIVVGDHVVKKGTYLYANMSGFGQQRVKGQVSSIFYDEDIMQVALSIYDTDGLEGLYVPESKFRETSKEILESATSGGSQIITPSSGASSGLKNWANQAAQNVSQRVMNTATKLIRSNSVRLKYGTLVYLIDSSEKLQQMKASRRQ